MRSRERIRLFVALVPTVLLASTLHAAAAAPADARVGHAPWPAPVGGADQTVVSSTGFAHPGVDVSRTGLATAQTMVRAGKEPWKSSFEKVRGDLRSSPDYTLQGPVADTPNDSGAAAYRLEADGTAAQYQTLMWYITSDQRYADNALRIIRAWAGTVVTMRDGIRGGPGVAKMTGAAEILRYTTGSGWTTEDTAAYSKMLRIVLLPRNEGGIDSPNWFMNQAGCVYSAELAAAVFLDDRALYDKLIHRLTVGENSEPGMDIALSRQIAANGQVTEMGRDQPHAQGDIDPLAAMAQTAFIQRTLGQLGDSGVDLFTYLDNRLLKGAEFLSTYNLGYDVPWTPVVFTTGERYAAVSSSGRGVLLSNSALLYNHYKYVRAIADSQMPMLKRQFQLGASRSPFATMIYTPTEAAAPQPGTGQPGPPASTGLDPRFGRFSAADFDATSDQNDIRTDPWTDADGTRMIVRDIRVNGWIEYKDFDFGTVARDTLLMSAGVNSKVPTKVAIHLDSLNGELLGTGSILPTGWYTTWATTATKLTRPLSGKHTLVMRFSGSDNVYKWQGGIDWFKVASGSAKLQTSIADAAVRHGTTSGPSGIGLTFGTGAYVGYRDYDFDNGSAALTGRAISDGTAVFELRQGSPDGTAVASYQLPDTHGNWQNFSRPSPADAILGRSDFYLVQVAGTPASLDWFRYERARPVSAPIAGTDYYAAIEGRATTIRDTADNPAYLQVNAGSTVTFPRIDFNTGASVLGVLVRAPRGGRIEVRIDKRTNTPIAATDLPASPQWRWINVPLVPKAPNGQLILSVDSALSLQTIQPDPINLSSPQVSFTGPTRWFTGERYTAKVNVIDPDGRPVTLRAASFPAGARFNRRTSTITWTPRPAQAGTISLIMRADDGAVVTNAALQVQVSSSPRAALEQITADVNTSNTTPRSHLAYDQAVNEADAIVDDHAVPAALKSRYLEMVVTAAANLRLAHHLTPSGAVDILRDATVTASHGSWDKKLTAADAGKPAFDGQLQTSVDLSAPVSWVDVDLGTNPVALTSIRAFPRPGNARRLEGATISGSSDGASWTPLASLTGLGSAEQWHTRTVTDSREYRFLRFSGAGNSNVAELEYLGDVIDRAELHYLIDSAKLKEEAHYTPDSWATLQAALQTGQQQIDAPAPTQSALDTASSELRRAVGALTPQ